jgi:hypothetical protein
MAFLVHPDKNGHHLAKDAFQKVQKSLAKWI